MQVSTADVMFPQQGTKSWDESVIWGDVFVVCSEACNDVRDLNDHFDDLSTARPVTQVSHCCRRVSERVPEGAHPGKRAMLDHCSICSDLAGSV